MSHGTKVGVSCLWLLVIGVGCGAQEDTETRQRSVVGAPVRRVQLPAGISCPQDNGSAAHVAISVGVVPAGLLAESPALPDDKVLLATSCRNAAANGGNNIYFIDPGSNDVTETDVTGTLVYTLPTTVPGPEGFPRFGWGSFAFRGDHDPVDMLACSNPETDATPHAVYSVNLSTGVATKLFDAAMPTPGKPYCDGLAWDAWNDTIWMSPDISATAYHYINRENFGPRLDLPDLAVPAGCMANGSGNSGIAVVGPELFLACNGESSIFRIRQLDHSTIGSFSSGADRAEDLECDGFTFADGVDTSQKRSVLWTKDAFNPQFLSFEVPPGSCGLCRQAQRKDLNDDLTGPQRTRLFSLLLDYINEEVLQVHSRVFGTGTWHGGNAFFPGHRGYIGGFEIWILNVAAVTEDEKKLFVPLPRWTPEKAVPAEFEGIDTAACSAVGGVCSGLSPPASRSLVSMPLSFKLSDPADPARRPLCEYESLEEIRIGGNGRPSLEGPFHGAGHCTATGGTMCDAISPAAPIFWPWHALLDDVAREYECTCRTSCNTCTDIYQPPPVMTMPFGPVDARSSKPKGRPGLAAAPIGYWWWFEDEVFPEDLSPDVVIDHAGYHIEGRVRGRAKLVPGLVGQTLELDGRDDFVEAREPGAGDVGTADFTLDAWIRTSDTGAQTIVDKQRSGGRGYELFLDAGQLGLSLGAGDEEDAFVTETASIADGAWHHVAAVVSRTDPQGSALFVDGQLVLAFDATPLAGDASSSAPLRIGRTRGAHDHGRCAHQGRAPRHHGHPHHHRHHHHADDRSFKGNIDELALLRHAISKDMVASIFIAGSAGKFGSAGNLPTSAEQPLCVVGLEEKIHHLRDEFPAEAAALDALYHQVVAAIEAGNQGLARLRLRQLRDLSLVGHEARNFLNVHFHSVHGHADRCLGLPRLRLD